MPVRLNRNAKMDHRQTVQGLWQGQRPVVSVRILLGQTSSTWPGVNQTTTDLQSLLHQHNQSHLWDHATSLPAAQREPFLAELAALRWQQLPELIDSLVLKDAKAPCYDDFQPAPYYPLPAESPEQASRYASAYELGDQAIREGRVAAVTVAGGQGTRLGHDGPKGTYPVSPIRQKSLFQLFAETILRESERSGRPLFWYIMTSPSNNQPTIDYFKQNGFFGLGEEQVRFFPQGTMPVFGLDGKLLLAEPGVLARSPDGHGGCLQAMRTNNCLEHMRQHGVEFLSYFQIDNPLVTIFDRTFIGLHIEDCAQMSSRFLMKRQPHDRLGNFGLLDGKLTVIEYSDLPDAMAQRREPDGRLTIRLGSPGIHLLNRDFVTELTEDRCQLPFHRAVKQVPYLDPETGWVAPTDPNAVKLEQFIFDAFPRAQASVLYQAIWEQELGPVKNATGSDSPESSAAMQVAEFARWLEAKGFTVPRNAAGAPVHPIEISPRAYATCEDFVAHGPDALTVDGPLYIE